MAKKDEKILYNRIKSELADAQISNQELAKKLDVAVETVSSWCTNSAQPSIKRLFDIARVLDINVQKLLVPTRPNRLG
ncbi:helix-turn-helix transcriptional regulator [Mucilaginibacter achroorhodeus]|uniref:Helix-turn-helix transcriptional regulator n=1 Tax=Mucilaginibacter achroorhodeus TaxID=2599294 RepID=A0A563U600_9SPHI|nr:helix-turn-helix transcriptional regulator [Mucilaginibacter achroorhodeus]TWR26786.1 helix-turn-helix transcriptional regulator [Mucilaginibacter achroorhodeus]